MAEKLSTYQKLHKKYVAKTASLISDDESKRVFDVISHGENKFMKVHRTESCVFDVEWINRITDCIPDLNDIVSNPKKITKTLGNLVPVELAKKTTALSVQHLASHTQFVKEINEHGDVIPTKVLSIETDDEYLTYENRFIATLIRKLVVFIEKRYEFIMKYTPLKDYQILKMKSSSILDGSTIEIDTTVKITKPADYKGIADDMKFTQQIIDMRKFIRFFYSSGFMKMFKNEKDIRTPIVMTNILRKNPKYNKCYKLFEYITSFKSLGIEFGVTSEYEVETPECMEEYNKMLYTNFLAIDPHKPSIYAEAKSKSFKPKMSPSLDDEALEYGPILTGPIEYVRVDQPYREAMFKIKELKPELDPEEMIFYSKEIQTNQAVQEMEEETEEFLGRKKKENEAFEEKAQRIIAKREANAMAKRIRMAKAQAEEVEKVNEKMRKKLIEDAQKDMQEMEKDDK